MTSIASRRKSLWQRFYSALGFWTYTSIYNGVTYRIVYWWGFGRKWDILRVRKK